MTTAGEDPVGRPVGEPNEVTDSEINEALEDNTLEEEDLRGRKIDHRDGDD
jgi:hypothetical protein